MDSIAFIGGGNMATSLIGGLVADGYPADAIWVTDVDDARLASLHDRFGVRTSKENPPAVARARTVVLAVKPQVLGDVCRELAESLQANRPLVISIAAGVREPDIRRWVGYDAAIVRCMPNTPALLGAGATGLCANQTVSAAERSAADKILRAAGSTVWVDREDLLDAVTAVSGSGPAYFFRLMELMEQAGQELGLSQEVSRQLTLRTALGAARMALEGDDPPGILREKVTSPGGTTQRALELFDEGGFEALVTRALTGARDRAIELGDDLGAEGGDD